MFFFLVAYYYFYDYFETFCVFLTYVAFMVGFMGFTYFKKSFFLNSLHLNSILLLLKTAKQN